MEINTTIINKSLKEVSKQEIKALFDESEAKLRATPFGVGFIETVPAGYLTSIYFKCGKENKPWDM